MTTQTLNPILVLAAAASRSGNNWFAADLLSVSRGRRDCKAIRKRVTRLKGLSDLSVAFVVEHSLLVTGSASLKRPHVKAA